MINLPATDTPDWLARDMVALASLKNFEKILEPSAGSGNILRHIVKHNLIGSSVTAFELNKVLFNSLSKDFHYSTAEFYNYDFLDRRRTSHSLYTKIIMNPPHKNCVAHVKRAFTLLEKGGTVVALVHDTYLNEINSIIPGSRNYHIPEKTFVLPNGEYLLATIVVGDK